MMGNKSVRMIVVTGGTQSGISDLIKWIDREFSKKGFTVLTISDTAADIVGGGIVPDKFINDVSFPTLLYELQHAKETVYKKAAYQMTAGSILIVCEHAIQDYKAYIVNVKQYFPRKVGTSSHSPVSSVSLPSVGTSSLRLVSSFSQLLVRSFPCLRKGPSPVAGFDYSLSVA